MARQIAGLGNFGMAFETTVGTYVAPSVWIPIQSESIQEVEDKQWQMNIVGKADRQDPIQGYTRVQGDVTFQVNRESILYFLYISRMTPAKTGTATPFTYTFAPADVTEPTTAAGASTRKTASLHVKRADRVFAYTGCSITQLRFFVENSIIMCTATIIGQEEATQTGASATYNTQTPYSAGDNSVKADAPAASARTDLDTMEIVINDNGSAENRIKAGGRGPQFIKWGEREVTFSFESDFDTKDDFDDFTAQTKWEVELDGENSATDDKFTLTVNAAAIEAYETGLSSLGDLVRARVNGHGYWDGTNDAYDITVLSSTDIT